MRGRTPRFVAVVVGSVVLGGAWAGAQTQSVDVQDNNFAPATVTIAAGGTVTWTQSGANPHTVTAADGSFDSHPACPGDCMGQGDTFSQTFDTPGEYDYFCKIHGAAGQGMAGTVVVEAVAQEPEPEPEPEEDDPATDEPPAEEPEEQAGAGDASSDGDEATGAGSSDDGSAAGDERGDTADEQQLADTGARLLLLPLGLGLVLGGVLAVRRGGSRAA